VLRLISAAVLAPLALGALWLGAPYFTILVVVAAGIMGWELARLTLLRPGAAGIALIATAIAVTALAGLAYWNFALLALAGGTVTVAALALSNSASRAAWAALGLIWIASGSLAALWLRELPGSGRNTLLWLFAVVWASDSAAYLVGKTLGGPLLAARLSPGKTWSGAFGGLAGAGMVGAATEKLLGIPLLSAVLWASVVLSVVSQAGDLLESLAKRRFGVKDTSGLIPGHGGFLDRLDALLAVLLVIAGANLITRISPLDWP
jgi:phosphatidate cytidylyltransferase